MDLLFLLQNIRESVSPVLTSVFMFISDAVTYGVPVAALVIYWCGNKNTGKKLFTELVYGFWFNGIMKLTACIYRPWVRDSRLHVAPQAESTATGYSFPSAHTSIAAIGFSNLATHAKKNIWRVVSIFMMILVMLSRMWLGCHSLADVLAGLIIGIATMLAVRIADNKLDGRSNKSLIMFVIAAVLSVISIIYIEAKPYPMDHDAAGKLIVDAADMKPDTYMGIAMILGWSLGNLIEDRWIHFSTEGTTGQKIIRTIIGAALFFGTFKLLKVVLGTLNPCFVKFLRIFISALVAVDLYPWLFTKWRNRKK